MKTGVKLNVTPRKVVRFDATYRLVWDFQRMPSRLLSLYILPGLVLFLWEGKQQQTYIFSEVFCSTQSHFSHAAIRSIPKVTACLFCNEVLF